MLQCSTPLISGNWDMQRRKTALHTVQWYKLSKESATHVDTLSSWEKAFLTLFFVYLKKAIKYERTAFYMEKK